MPTPPPARPFVPAGGRLPARPAAPSTPTAPTPTAAPPTPSKLDCALSCSGIDVRVRLTVAGHQKLFSLLLQGEDVVLRVGRNGSDRTLVLRGTASVDLDARPAQATPVEEAIVYSAEEVRIAVAKKAEHA